jgi:hypothetical protein
MKVTTFDYSIVSNHPDYDYNDNVIEFTEFVDGDENINFDTIVDRLIGNGLIPVNSPQITGRIIIDGDDIIMFSFEKHSKHIN